MVLTSPRFRKDILREIRQTKEVPSIEQFWSNWLHQMSNAVRTIEATFREVLDIDGNQQAGILPMQVAANEADAGTRERLKIPGNPIDAFGAAWFVTPANHLRR